MGPSETVDSFAELLPTSDGLGLSVDITSSTALDKRLSLTLKVADGAPIPNVKHVPIGVPEAYNSGFEDDCDLRLTLERGFSCVLTIYNWLVCEDVSRVVEVKRGPGRPRKTPLRPENSCKGVVTKVGVSRRGPGRPRKRRRGRPLKAL